MKIRDWLPILGMPIMLLAVQILAIVSIYAHAGGRACGVRTRVGPKSLFFIGILLVFTLFLLLLMRFGGQRFIAVIVGFALFMTFLYIFSSLSLLVLGTTDAAAIVALVSAGAATALLYFYPEWYVIDILGVLISAGVTPYSGYLSQFYRCSCCSCCSRSTMPYRSIGQSI